MPSEMRWVSGLILTICTLTCRRRPGLRRVVDALPAHVGDVQQAVDAAQVHERAVVGDVLDHAFAHFAFVQLADQLGALLGAGFFQDGAARDDDVAAAAVHLEDGERLVLAHQRADVAHRADVDLAARQEGQGARRSTVKPPFTRPTMVPIDRLVVGERLLETVQASSRRALSRDRTASPSSFSMRSTKTSTMSPSLISARAGSPLANSRRCDAAFGLQADIDDDEIIGNANDRAFDDRSFEARRTAERFVEKCCERRSCRCRSRVLRRALPLAIQDLFLRDPGRNAAARRPTG